MRSNLLAAATLLLALPAQAATTIDPAIRDASEAPSSFDRERGLYALMRFYDPSVRDDRDRIDVLWFKADDIARAAMLRGTCDRALAGGAIGKASLEWILSGLDSLDVGVRSAAIECLERYPPERAPPLRLEQLEDVRGRGLPPMLTRAVLAAIVRHPDPKCVEILGRHASSELRSRSEFTTLTADGAWLVLALAANGTNVEPMFSTTLKESADTDFPLRARLNAIRAVRGDDVAFSALVETANVAVDRNLRRDAVDLLLALPDGLRAKAVAGLASRMDDIDGPLRARLVREMSREAAGADAATEKILVRAAGDVFPDLRAQAVAGLFDRAGAGTLSPEALAAARTLAGTEKDPLVAAAFRALFAKADAAKPRAPDR